LRELVTRGAAHADFLPTAVEMLGLRSLPSKPGADWFHAIETMLRLHVKAKRFTMPANEMPTSALRVLLSVATSTVLIIIAHTWTIISSTAQNSSSNVMLINDSLSTTFGSSDRKTAVVAVQLALQVL
jgi:hypothetical protein